MNNQILIDELTNDPLERGYVNMTDEAVEADLKTAYRTRRVLVPLWMVKKTLIESQEWPAIVAGQASATPNIAGLCLTVVSYIDDLRFENLNMDLQSTQTMMGGLVAAGLVAQATVDAVDDLADEAITRAEELGIPDVSNGNIKEVRSVINGD